MAQLRSYSSPTRTVALAITLLAALALSSLAATQATPNVQSPSPAAAAYYQWFVGCVAGIKQDIPTWTATLDAAAKRYVDSEDSSVGVMGDQGFAGEISGRSGGIMRMLNGPREPQKSIILYAIREDRIDKSATETRDMFDKGVIVVAFGRPAVLAQAKKSGAKWTFAVNNHAAAHGGLFKAKNGKWIVPTDPTANAIASWTWVGEFAAACSRLGKFPVFYEGYAVPGGMEWDREVGKMKFHPEAPYQSPAGRYGRDYLRNLKKDIDAVYFTQEVNMGKVARMAVANRKAGKGVYAFVHGHCAMEHMGYPGDPGYFVQCNNGWFAQKKEITLKPGDFVFCVGFDQIFEDWQFKTWTSDTRKAGVKLAWSITDYNENPVGVGAIKPGEILVDQRWSNGDAVVNVPQHPVNICPTSGVISEYVLWSTNAEVHGILKD